MTKTITCECGSIIRGQSKKHAESNLKLHKKSRKHKELMKLKKEHQDTLNHKKTGAKLSDEQNNSDGNEFRQKKRSEK